MKQNTYVLLALLLLLVSSCKDDDNEVNGTGIVEFSLENLAEIENATSSLNVNIGVDSFNHGGGTVDVTISGGVYGTDYETSQGADFFTLDIDAQSLLATFSLQPIDDELIEENQDLTITLSNATGNLNLGDNTALTFTIIDNDDPLIAVVGFEVSQSQIQENATDSNQINIAFSQETTDGGIISITSSGDAVFGTDYSIVGQTTSDFDLVIPAGATSASFEVQSIDNSVFGADKDIVFSISGVDGGLSIGTETTHTLTIENDDLPPNPIIDFDATNTLTYNEDAGTITLNFELSGTTTSDATVELTTSGDADASDFNFNGSNANPFVLNIPSGSSSASVDISILDDSDIELDETITLTISSVSGGLDAGVSLQSQTITITDNDFVPFNYVETFESITNLSDIGYETVLIGQDPSFPNGSVLKYHNKVNSYTDVNDVSLTSDNGMQIFHNISGGAGILDHMVITQQLVGSGSMTVNLDVAYITGINKNTTEITYYYSDTYSGSGSFVESEWNVMGTATAASLDAEGIARTQFKREAFTINPTGNFYVAIRVFQDVNPVNDVVQWRFDNFQVNSN
ncbi:Calx-beta domain-containing protein [Winogradskyella litorisediminis]|uniref:Calx-beta domain-containing protein n=1 Tax=Winogradskyella litorisediminis TaxID=1156618 RepID=A0ABW3N730_9FLAO